MRSIRSSFGPPSAPAPALSFSPALALAVSLAVAAGCSHEQKVAAARPAKVTPPVAERAPAPRKLEAPAMASADAPKNKEGDAIYFDFDSAALRDDARPVLQDVADSLRRHGKTVKIEGNCDELGTIEYNLALGDQRARAAKEYLVRMGVPPTRISTLSYGSQRPKDPGHDDAAHAKNRRDDFLVE